MIKTNIKRKTNKVWRKLFCAFLPAILMLNLCAFGAEQSSDDEDIVLAQEVLFENFEGIVSPRLTPESRLSVIDYEKNKVLRINAMNGFTSTQTMLSDLTDCMVEVDFKQMSSVSALSGNSIALRCTNYGQLSYKFVYADTIFYNPDTYKPNGPIALRDRMLFARSDNLHNMSNYHFAHVSDKPTGVLDSQNRTPWIKAKAIIYKEMMYCVYYDMNGNELMNMSAPLHDADWKGILKLGVSSIAKGGVILAAQNSDVYFDNFRISKLSALKSVEFGLSQNKADMVQPVRFWAKGEDDSGNTANIKNNVQFECDESITIDKENELISFGKAGTYEIKMKYIDPVFGKTIEKSQTVTVVEKFGYKKIDFITDKTGTFKNSPITFSIFGITNEDNKIELFNDYQVSGEGAKIVNNQILFDQSGKKEIAVEAGGVKTNVTIIVSDIEAVFFELSDNHPKVGDAVYFKLSALKNRQEIMLNSCDYQVSYDKDAMTILGNKMILKKIGQHKVTFIVDGELKEYMINVAEKTGGIILQEKFEKRTYESNYIKYSESDITEEGLKLENRSTALWGDKALSDYSVETKFKIVNPKIDKDSFLSSFEILTKRGDKFIDGTDGSNGIAFCYLPSDKYMRISTFKGKELDINDGNWHTAKVTNIGNQLIFTIDDVVQYHNGYFYQSGYFQLRANNCEVLVESVTLIKEENTPPADCDSIISLSEEATVNPYEPFNVTDYTAVKAIHNEEQAFVTGEVQWEIVSGMEHAMLYRGTTLRWNDGVKAGDKITLKGSYKGKECFITFIAKLPPMSKEDYIKATTKIRRQSYAYLLTCALDKRVVIGQSTLGIMPGVFAQMLIYPKMYDYTPYVMWHVNQADYEETIVTRVMGGGDFVMLQMTALYNELYGKVNASEESWKLLKDYLVETHYPDEEEWMSENHRLVYFCMALLAAEAWPQETYMQGRSANEMTKIYTDYLKTWIDNRLREGMGEYDSGYIAVDLFALETLYTYITDEKIKKMSYDMITYLYADMLNDSIDSNIAGAHLRLYMNKGLTDLQKFVPFDILFYNGTDVINEKYMWTLQAHNYTSSSYLPPKAVYDLALDRNKTFENYEKKGIYRIPDDSLVDATLEKYTYMTPEYAMGCQLHTDYMKEYYTAGNIVNTGTWKSGTSVIPGHQEVPWTLQLSRGNETFIADSHPGSRGVADTSGTHGYFSGDMKCLCYKYHQYKNTSIGMHKITLPNELKFTHFWLPREHFDIVSEENGWVFLKYQNTYIALKPLKDGKTSGELYEWGDPKVNYVNIPLSKVELKINSANTAFVCEVYNTNEFKGSFEEFKTAIHENEAKNPIQYSVGFDYYIEYTNLGGTTLKIDYERNERLTNGAKLDFSQFALHNSPYMQSQWNSGNVKLFYGDEEYTITSPKIYDNVQNSLERIREFKQQIMAAQGGKLKELIEIHIDEIVRMIDINTNVASEYIKEVFVTEQREIYTILNAKKSDLGSDAALKVEKLKGR